MMFVVDNAFLMFKKAFFKYSLSCHLLPLSIPSRHSSSVLYNSSLIFQLLLALMKLYLFEIPLFLLLVLFILVKDSLTVSLQDLPNIVSMI